MAKHRSLFSAAMMALLAASAGIAFGQTAPSAETIAERLRGQGVQVTPEQIEQGRRMMQDLQNGVQPDPEQIQKMIGDFRKQAQDQLKVRLGATDEEWVVLEPKITAVQNLQMQRGGAGNLLARFNFGAATQPSELQKTRQALQNVLRNKDALTSEIKAALDAYRAAQTKLNTDIEQAQKELRALLITRQEAILIQMGLLE